MEIFRKKNNGNNSKLALGKCLEETRETSEGMLERITEEIYGRFYKGIPGKKSKCF